MKPCMHNQHRPTTISRREFLKAMGVATAGLTLAGCQFKVPEIGGASDQKPAVAIAKADSYERKLIRRQVERLLDKIGGLKDVLAHGNRVAIKTNLTGGIKQKPLPGIPEIESYLTHPEVVRALGELLRDAGVKDLFIVEAVYEKESWTQYGYEDMAKSIGATLVDLNYEEPYKDFITPSPGDKPFFYDKFIFNPILSEVDAFVSVSKMKCHNTAGVTHTMKNLFGLVPYRFYTMNPEDTYRSGFHGEGEAAKERVPGIIIDLNRTRPIHLSLIDGVMTTEAGEGPWVKAMAQIKPGLMFAGKNPVATDAVATAAMGYDPTADFPNEPFVHAVNHLNLAAQAGLGTNRLEEIKVVGEPLEEVTVRFKTSY